MSKIKVNLPFFFNPTNNFIHVMKDGKIIKTGSAELAKQLEKKGYEWLEKSS